MATGSPCGACKFLRRKCVANYVFAPYFCSEQGAAKFAMIHKVFGASNVFKLLQHLPVHERCDAVVSTAYEAQARITDPVFGCVAHIFALQQQVAYSQAQIMQLKAQILATATAAVTSNPVETQYYQGQVLRFNGDDHPLVSSSPLDQRLVAPIDSDRIMALYHNRDQDHGKFMLKRLMNDTGELQELALRMMRN